MFNKLQHESFHLTSYTFHFELQMNALKSKNEAYLEHNAI